MLPASFGDSLLIEYGDQELHYILIDGGPYYAFIDIIKAIRKIAPTLVELELVVVTHVDIDHIDGIVKLLNQEPLPFKIKDIWFNGFKELEDAEASDLLGGLQGEYLSRLIKEKGIPHNSHKDIKGGSIAIGDVKRVLKLEGGMALTLLSPTVKALEKLEKAWKKELKDKKVNRDDINAILEKLNGDHRYKDEEDSDLLGDEDVDSWASSSPKEDNSAANGSSIAFIAEYDGKKCLFAGDATSKNLLKSLEDYDLVDDFENLEVDAWKLSHHGSKKSNQQYLMDKITTNHYLISSDGKRYHHPDPETISKLIAGDHPTYHFHFSAHSEYADFWEDEDLQDDYDYETHFPEDGENFKTLAL